MKRLLWKKQSIVLMLVLVSMLSGCSIQQSLEGTYAQQPSFEPGVQVPIISPYQETYQRNPQAMSLYYRMRGENLLTREMSYVDMLSDKTIEESLIQALIYGPSPSLMELTGVFIPGTKIVRIGSEGDILLVTLSHHFLDTPVDMPENWRDVPSLREEVLLRRRLALASIVSTITDETNYTSVQLFIAIDEKDTSGRRISRSEIYDDANSNTLLAPVVRSEEYLLTHHSAADIILDSIQNRDYERLYRFVADPPTEDTFLQEMYAFRSTLTAFTLSAGMVSSDGQTAMLVADLTFANSSGILLEQHFPLRITHENNLWKIQYEMLRKIMEAT